MSLAKGTPYEIIKKLEGVLSNAVKEKDFVDLMAKIRFPVNFRGYEATRQYMAEQNKEMSQLFAFLRK